MKRLCGLLVVLSLIFAGLPLQGQTAAVKTSVEMKVMGVLAVNGGKDKRSSAMIGLTKDGGHVETYYPGQSIGGDSDLKLVRVGNDTIEFLNHGRLEFAPVKHFPDAGWGSNSPSAPSVPAVSADARDDARAAAGRKPRPPRPPKRSSTGGSPADLLPSMPATDGQDPAND
jgi:hypothetical protein